MATDDPERFLRPPFESEKYETVYRGPSNYNPMPTFALASGGSKHYQQQYADMYFLRLARLKPVVADAAAAAWEGYNIAGEHAHRVERVLDVRQGELCWVTGTVYMDLPLKPNILDDIAKEHWTAAPPPRPSYADPTNQNSSQTMLEDESGRLRLTGTLLQSLVLVTGTVVAVLGTENADGDFEVVDMKVPDFPMQPERWERDTAPGTAAPGKRKRDEISTGDSIAPRKKIALVSGLNITGNSGDSVTLSLLTDYLLGYSSFGDQNDSSPRSNPTHPAQISRLIIAGNSLGNSAVSAADDPEEDPSLSKKKNQPAKKYGYDASAYNASPITHLDTFLAEILPSIPVTLMPGENDPANFALPQQAIHRAMLPQSKAYCASVTGHDDTATEPGWLDSVTNPWQGDVEGWRLWGCSGQNVDDVLRYIMLDEGAEDKAERDGNARISLMESMLRWRCAVPTAPDTIWCYPFQDSDPFVLEACPHVFFAANQPQFRTAVVESGSSTPLSEATDESRTHVRLLTLPKFSETGQLVLLDSETLEVEVIEFSPFDTTPEADETSK